MILESIGKNFTVHKAHSHTLFQCNLSVPLREGQNILWDSVLQRGH